MEFGSGAESLGDISYGRGERWVEVWSRGSTVRLAHCCLSGNVEFEERKGESLSLGWGTANGTVLVTGYGVENGSRATRHAY